VIAIFVFRAKAVPADCIGADYRQCNGDPVAISRGKS